MKTDKPAATGQRQPDNSGAALNVESEVRRLLALDKCKQAVELAKDHHKRVNTADSQRLLVQAYLARIVQFQNKHMDQEAQTLLTLVKERFPAEREQLRMMEIRAAAASGRWRDLLAPLAVEQTSAEARAAIEAAVGRYVTDLPALAACEALPTAHPLRVGAAAVWRAFLAVTKGPVTDAEIALPEVSHRSPLAAWKMLIRAIAGFYRQDDSACRRALDAIPADAAVAHLAAALRGMIECIKPSAGIALALCNRVLAADQELRAALRKVESSLDFFDRSRLQSAMREAVHLCAQSRPELLERMRRQILIACIMRNVPASEAAQTLGLVLANASYWRSMARLSETEMPEVICSLYWERFLRHAVHEGMFTASSAEAATVWLHIAEMLARVPLSRLEYDREKAKQSCLISEYYIGQPAEIAALRPASDQALADEVMDPSHAFQQAARIRPDAETFGLWWAWAQRVNLPDKQKEDVLLEWQRRRPGDVQAPVHLALLAEARNALSLALKRLAEAEAIDPLNPQVRQARVRLTLSILRRHFADGKPHLVQKDLAELEALPGMGEGDRAGVVEALRCAWHQLRQDQPPAVACFDALVQRMGVPAASIVSSSVMRFLGITGKNDPVKIPADIAPLDVAQTQARLTRLTADLQITMLWPTSWIAMIVQVLRQRPCPLSSPDLLALGRGGVDASQMELAYLASAAGLVRADSPAATARFLLLRAKSLKEPMQYRRAVQCLRAALELARQAHDEELIRDVFGTVDLYPFSRGMIGNSADKQGLGAEVLHTVLESERKADAYPRSPADVASFVVAGATDGDASPYLDYEDAYADWEDDEDDVYDDEDDDFDDIDDDDDPGLFDFGAPAGADAGFPPGGPSPQEMARLQRALERQGINSPEELLANPILLIEAFAKAMGQKLSPAELHGMVEKMKEITDNPGVNPPPDFFGGGGSKKNRKRRRR